MLPRVPLCYKYVGVFDTKPLLYRNTWVILDRMQFGIAVRASEFVILSSLITFAFG